MFPSKTLYSHGLNLEINIYIYKVSIIHCAAAFKCLNLFQTEKFGCSLLRPDDTTELMEEAARVALCSNKLTSVDSTAALLKTFALAEPGEENTFCMIPTVPSHCHKEQQLDNEVHQNGQPAIKTIPGICLSFCLSRCCTCNPAPVKGMPVIEFQVLCSSPLNLDTNKGHVLDGMVVTSAKVVKDHSLCASAHQNSSFEVISLESR